MKHKDDGKEGKRITRSTVVHEDGADAAEVDVLVYPNPPGPGARTRTSRRVPKYNNLGVVNKQRRRYNQENIPDLE